jgi:hypothetical protein
MPRAPSRSTPSSSKVLSVAPASEVASSQPA